MLLAVDRQFDATLSDCPGAEKCEKPKATNGGCTHCPLRKETPEAKSADARAEALHASRLVTEKRAGYGRSLEELDPLGFELILLWEAREAANRNGQMAQVTEAAVWLTAYAEYFADKV